MGGAEKRKGGRLRRVSGDGGDWRTVAG